MSVDGGASSSKDPSPTTTTSAAGSGTISNSGAADDGSKGRRCPVCHMAATKRCSRCRVEYYCSAVHQKEHWPTHRADCNDAVKADDYTRHKREFDLIVRKHGLDSDAKAGEIAEYLTTSAHRWQQQQQQPQAGGQNQKEEEGGHPERGRHEEGRVEDGDTTDNGTGAQLQGEQEHRQQQVSPQEFAERFGMTVEEAVVFLGWIKVGVQFKEQSIDVANRSGFGKVVKDGETS